jgi:endonuclease-3
MRARSPLARDASERLVEIDRLLARAYGTPESALGNKDDPLDEAIYIILSFQTDLARSGETWGRLRAAYPTWEVLEQAPVRDIAAVLRRGGLYRQKARAIKRLLAKVRRVAGVLALNLLRSLSDEDAERVLTKLPGLSWKGARCVLLYSLRRSAFPVDGNTFRILRRSGVVRRGAVYRRRTLHDSLQAAVSPPRRRALHVNLVIHGQHTCRPLRPRCDRCALLRLCPREGLPPGVVVAGQRPRLALNQFVSNGTDS